MKGIEKRLLNNYILIPWFIFKWILITTLLSTPIKSDGGFKDADVIHTEILLDSRPPSSPVKAILRLSRWRHDDENEYGMETEYDYADKNIMFWTPWEYCEGNTFLAGVQGMIRFNSHGDREMRRIRLNCESIEGEYNGDIYAGVGNDGKYGEAQKCNSIATTAEMGFGRISTTSDCSTFGIIAVNINCLKPGNKSATVITVSSYYPHWWAYFRCPPNTALCGVRAKVLKHGHEFLDCYWTFWSSNYPRKRPHMLRLEFACCQYRLPGDSCSADYLWENKLTCRKNLACKFTLTSVLSETNTNTTVASRLTDMTGTLKVDPTAKWGPLSLTVNLKYSYKGLWGTNSSDILKTISTEKQSIEIDMTGCDGSVQQLAITCGPYAANSKNFRCLEFTGYE